MGKAANILLWTWKEAAVISWSISECDLLNIGRWRLVTLQVVNTSSYYDTFYVTIIRLP